ncbi:MAG TPA: iron ABC transporter permease [Acidimicrobiia bacterium]|nr:iron ABC transporter permease [Acidimicrobiia bacterium]
MRRIRWGWVAVAALPVLFVGYFFVYPLARILALGLSELSIGSSGVEARLWRVGWFTLWQATVSTILTFLAAAPLTWAVSSYQFKGRRLAMALATVPFVLPTVVVGTAFVALGWRESIVAILAAHVFFNVAVVVRTVSTLWSRIDPRIQEAARVLGASEWVVFRRITLPLLRPALAAAASIVFLFTFTSFGVVLILGGFQYATLEVEIYRQAVTLFDLPLAAALAIVQLLGVSGALYWYSRYQERTAVSWTLERGTNLRRPRGRARIGVLVATVGTLAALAMPLSVLVSRSLTGPFYRSLFADNPVLGSPISSVWNSLMFAGVATLVATIVGILAATVITERSGGVSRWFDLTLMLPLGTSAVTIGFGFIVALDWPIDLRASRWLVPMAHALVAIPFVVRSTVPTLRSIPIETRQAASVLGASPFRVWREIDLPIVSRAAMVGAGFAFVISLGEFGATSFVSRPDSATIPTMIFRLLSRPGETSLGMAMALSVVLALLTASVVMAVDRARFGELGTF